KLENGKPEKKVRREPDVGKIIDRTIVRLWDTIEELEALTPAELRFYRVSVFGSARIKSGDQEYGDVKKLAERLTELGRDTGPRGRRGRAGARNGGGGPPPRTAQDAFHRPDDRDPVREGDPVSRQRPRAPDVFFPPAPLRADVAGVRDLSGGDRDDSGA